ncbi:MAG: hypothetical protein J6S67_01355 [Methanobrevibacter sp.]|nr:hypothetical protein [Methanobrevibacter sp.]
MARQRMVTRTIVTREVAFKKFNMETAKVESDMIAFGVNVTINNDTKGIATINERLASMGQKATCVMIDSITDKETLYGMTEDEFIQNARVLPPRTTETEEE